MHTQHAHRAPTDTYIQFLLSLLNIFHWQLIMGARAHVSKAKKNTYTICWETEDVYTLPILFDISSTHSATSTFLSVLLLLLPRRHLILVFYNRGARAQKYVLYLWHFKNERELEEDFLVCVRTLCSSTDFTFLLFFSFFLHQKLHTHSSQCLTAKLG